MCIVNAKFNSKILVSLWHFKIKISGINYKTVPVKGLTLKNTQVLTLKKYDFYSTERQNLFTL